MLSANPETGAQTMRYTSPSLALFRLWCSNIWHLTFSQVDPRSTDCLGNIGFLLFREDYKHQSPTLSIQPARYRKTLRKSLLLYPFRSWMEWFSGDLHVESKRWNFSRYLKRGAFLNAINSFISDSLDISRIEMEQQEYEDRKSGFTSTYYRWPVVYAIISFYKFCNWLWAERLSFMSATYWKVDICRNIWLVYAHFALLKIAETFPWRYAFC